MSDSPERTENSSGPSDCWKTVFFERPENPNDPRYPEPKSCAYCHASESVVETAADRHRVKCPVCKLTGPEMNTAISAINAWGSLCA